MRINVQSEQIIFREKTGRNAVHRQQRQRSKHTRDLHRMWTEIGELKNEGEKNKIHKVMVIITLSGSAIIAEDVA